MKGIGGFLALAGVISIVLHFIGYNLRILIWIDRWGTGVGWGIRIGLVVVGGILFLVGVMRSPDEPPTEQDDDDD
jgi:hypothetical protein